MRGGDSYAREYAEWAARNSDPAAAEELERIERRRRLNRERMARKCAEVRDSIVKKLGGRCVEPGCGTTKNLEFDHKRPRTWVAKKLGQLQRLRVYEREADQDLLELRCKLHNQRKGRPR